MNAGSATPKDQLRRLIDAQPDDSSYEEIVREMAFAAMVEQGLADAKDGRLLSHEEMGRAKDLQAIVVGWTRGWASVTVRDGRAAL